MERIDVAKLLKDCPSGMKLDSTLYENVVFEKVVEDDKKFPIRVIRSEDCLRMYLTKYGQYSDFDSAKCIIFPKGKTTWEGFHRPFKDGDIIYVCDEYSDATLTYVAILKQLEKGGEIICHCFYNYEEDYFSINDFLYDGYNTRFATEKEKEELFKVIKDNGYEWNPESKTLEKFIESKEDTEDKIVMSGIYFDKENYADEVELHLGNYEIEIRDGKTYAIFKNQETKNSKPRFKVGDRVKSIFNNYQYDIKELTDTHYTLVEVKNKFKYTEPIIEDKNWELVNEPKFKVGDKIKNKSLNIFNPLEITAVSPRIYTFTNGSFHYVETIDKDYELIIDEPKFKVGDRIRYPGDDFPIKIIDIKDNQYHIECFCDKHNVYKNGIIPVSQQDNYMLIPKFDITTLKPFDKVLVRTENHHNKWIVGFFSHKDSDSFAPFWTTADKNYQQCIPYEGNEHLLGTTNNCDEYFNLIS